MGMALAALVYEIWSKRNKAIWLQEEVTATEVMARVKNSVKNRFKGENCKCNIEDRHWIESL